MKRTFAKCLNSEPKIFNCSIGSLFLSGLMLIILGLGRGLMWGIGGAAVGFAVGGWISRQWFMGNFQRILFWYFPFSKIWIDRNIIESHVRRLI